MSKNKAKDSFIGEALKPSPYEEVRNDLQIILNILKDFEWDDSGYCHICEGAANGNIWMFSHNDHCVIGKLMWKYSE